MSRYKRGTITKNGITYGFYPDGSLFRIYDNDIPFFKFIDERGETFLRVKQATVLGYASCPVGGVVDIAYPGSAVRRSRTIMGGRLVNALTCGQNLVTIVEL